MSKLTVEALEQHHETNARRRLSVIHKDGSDSTGLNVTGPNLRRLSRPDHRLSVQYGFPGRRPSQVSRTSISGSVGPKHIGIPIKLQNTYRLEPLPKEKFDPSRVNTIMYNVLESYLDGEKYDPKMCSNLAQNLTDVIKNRVKELGYVRYKLICNVIIGENSAQGMRVASRCLWDASTDSYAQASYSKGEIYAVATVYATYFE
ncbi:dynein light chain Tctex-type protein 2B-like [Ylistrum balloti]|uniref:dynein light chain Tctex-type protein 2B-like n=1 Tax=Ylistrum balloti TaxID=509963 RepID=UPI002905BC88|nr:dynein light chain Tctex-type protein 2B-like [Ylistrum balloti]